MVNLGINGFGRIGRLAMRAALAQGVPVVGINDPMMDPEYMVYMLTHDSVHGHIANSVSSDGKNLIVDGKVIQVYSERDPNVIAWNGVDIVL